MVGYKLNGYKSLTKDKSVVSYLTPDKVYIPLKNGSNEDSTELVSKGNHVFKNMHIAHLKGPLKINIISSISGKVIGIEEKTFFNGQKVKCLVIENDYKEDIENNASLNKNITSYSKEEFLDCLLDAGIVGMGGASFPTYIKYSTDQKIKTLIINAVECEPYITTDYRMLFDYTEEILETIDAIMKINKIDNAILAIKKTHKSLINHINNYIGSYDHIILKTVPNLYPMGWERLLIEKTIGVEYDKLPIEQGIVVNNVSTIYAIYEALKYGKRVTERIITFSGDMLVEPVNMLVKTGTLLKDIMKELKFKKGNFNIIAGGPMMGSIVDEDLVISPSLNCVLFLEKKCDVEVTECIRCGKCAKVCPARLSPVLIKDYLKDIPMLKNLKADNCISCGLCSYICPSNIDVRSYTEKARDIVRKAG